MTTDSTQPRTDAVGQTERPARAGTVPSSTRRRRPPSDGRDDRTGRAISDLVGYVLTVGIILVSVGIVSTVGVGQIERIQGTQHVENAERAVTVLAGNVDELQESRAAVRTSEIAVNHGRIDVASSAGPSELEVEVSGAGFTVTDSYAMDTITYRIDDAAIAYEGGGVIFHDEGGSSIPVREPALVCSDDGAVVSVVSIHSPENGQGYSGGLATIVARLNESRLHFPAARSGPGSVEESTDVTVTVDSQYDDAWEEFLLDAGWTRDPANPSSFECEAPPGETMPVYVRETAIDVRVR